MSLSVFFRTSFVAFHRWSDAPDDHAYLRDVHRHVFYVEGSVAVTHANRDVEFISLKRLADQRIATQLIPSRSLDAILNDTNGEAARKDREALAKVADVALVVIHSRSICAGASRSG